MVTKLRTFWRARTLWRAEPKASAAVAAPRFQAVENNVPVDAVPASQPRSLLFVNQYYWPDHASTAQHLADLVEHLAAQGFDCHVICSRGTYRAGAPKLPAYEVHNGVHIHRVTATSLGRKSTLTRMIDYLSFYVHACMLALRLPRFDVVTTLTTPPIIGLVGTLLRRLKGSRHIYWSMDLHPDASIALGKMSKSHPVVAALAWLSDAVYRQADAVVTLGPYMADRIAAKRVKRDRMVQIPVWSRRDEITPLPREGHPLREEYGLSDKFVVMYSGNLGLAHSFEEFLEAARRLRDRKDIIFLFVGDGPRLVEVRTAKESEGLENVRLMDYFPRSMLHMSLSIADVHLISMRSEMTGIVVPGKLYGAMASSRPTIFVGPQHCESADTIRDAECGKTIDLGDVDGLVEAITLLADDHEVAESMGVRGREAFLAIHEKDACCLQWSLLIRDLLGIPRPSQPATIEPARRPTAALPRMLQNS